MVVDQNQDALLDLPETRPFRAIRSSQAPQRPGTDCAFRHRRGRTCGRRLQYLESISVDVVLHTGDTELPAALFMGCQTFIHPSSVLFAVVPFGQAG